MRGEGAGPTTGAVAMDASRSQFMELLLCHNKIKKKAWGGGI